MPAPSCKETDVDAEKHAAQVNGGQEDEDGGSEEDRLIPKNAAHSSYSELLRAASLQQACTASQPFIGHEARQAAWFEYLDAYFKWPDARFLTPPDEDDSHADFGDEPEDDAHVRTLLSLAGIQVERRSACFIGICSAAGASRLQDTDRRAAFPTQLRAAERACSSKCAWSGNCFANTVLAKGRLWTIIDLQASLGMLSALFPALLAVVCIQSVISGLHSLAIAAAFLALLAAWLPLRSRAALKEAALLIAASRAFHLHSGLAALLYSGLAWPFLSTSALSSSVAALLLYAWSSELLLAFASAVVARKAVHAWNPFVFQASQPLCAIVFASIIVPPLYLLRLVAISVRHLHRGAMLAFLERFLEPASPFAVIHATMTGEPCWRAGRSAARLFRRNLLPSATASLALQALAWPLLAIPLLIHMFMLGEWLHVYTLFTLLRFYYLPIVTSIDAAYWCYAVESDNVDASQSAILPSQSGSNAALARLFAAKQARGLVYPSAVSINNRRRPLY